MIGDVLVSGMLFEALKKKQPDWELHYLVNSHTVPVVENNPYIDELVLFTPEMEKNKFAFFRFLKKIRKEKYDVVIDVYGKLSSNLTSLFSGAKKKISKHKAYTAFLYSDTLKSETKTDEKTNLAYLNRLKLLEPLSIPFDSDLRPKIFLTENEKSSAKEKLLSNGIGFSRPILMMNVLGSHPNKTYPAEYMAKVLDFIVSKSQAQILFNYIPRQIEEAKSIFQKCKPATQEHIFFDFQTHGLRDFLAVLSHCDALIGNEGGGVNMAKALDIPTFAIFSSWIRKETWGSANDPKHVDVHLSDFEPEVFHDYIQKDFMRKSLELYKLFSPKLLEKKLGLFLKNIR